MSDDGQRGTDDFKARQRERARLARKAAYAKQKERLQERRAALRADPEFQRKQAERRQARRDRYLEEKKKSKAAEERIRTQDRLAERELSAAERSERDRRILAELIPASQLKGDHEAPRDTAVQNPGEQSAPARRPHLRLIKTES